MLHVHEIYTSIQGEGFYQGRVCTFVRLGGCPLRCAWCDTPEALTVRNSRTYEHHELVAAIKDYGIKLIEFTGGEPLIQRPEKVIQSLLDDGYTVMVETSGAVSVADIPRSAHIIMDLKPPGSGECKSNLFSNIVLLKPTDEVKFVLTDRKDYEWAKLQILEYRVPNPLLSAAWGTVSMKELAQWIIEDRLPVKLQTQLHKHIWGPEEKGV